MVDESFLDQYLDVMQNIESAIAEVYRDDANLLDYDAMSAYEALIDHYVAEKINRKPRNFALSARADQVFGRVKVACDWRLGREVLESEDGEKMDVPPKTVDEIIKCLKVLLNSAKKWNKSGGRQAYLNFISKYV